MLRVVTLALLLSFPVRDDGRYTNSPLHSWFDSLKSGNGLCCSFADGVTIEDVNWDIKDGHYRVYLESKWIDVPDKAVVKDPNRFGPAVVWPMLYNNIVIGIRCFMPGSMT